LEFFIVALFERYIGIDYSGTQTPVLCLSGLQLYEVTQTHLPREIKVGEGTLGRSKKKYWS